MDYRKTAKEILNHVGGSKNIVSAAHCATRLRLVIADNTKADKTALENVDGVKGVFEASGSAPDHSREQEPSTKYLVNLLQSQASQPARKQKQKKLLPKSRTGL